MSRPTSFYYAFLVLPRDEREAIIAVWDFCRAVDDVADEATGRVTGPLTIDDRRLTIDEIETRRAALAGWRAELGRVFDGTPETPQGRQLQPWVRRFDLPRRSFEDLVDGVEMDLRQSRYDTFDSLYEYCWRVASTVGLICLRIFGCPEAQGRDYAMHLGLALQLTNILRDVESDLARGRIYLPLENLARFGCTEDDLRRGRVTAPVRALLAFECTRAREYYSRARQAMPAGCRRQLRSAEIMAAIYEAILDGIEQRGYDVFAGRVRVARPRQAVIALRTWWRLRSPRAHVS